MWLSYIEYYPRYAREMSILVSIKLTHVPAYSLWLQVFEEGSTFRSTLKTQARIIAEQKYEIYPNINGPHNQLEYYEGITHNIMTLLEDSVYLRNGEDEQVNASFIQW